MARPCWCVLRRAFRECLAAYHAPHGGVAQSAITRDPGRSSGRAVSWGRRNEEFRADLEATARRLLDPLEWRVFRLWHLDGRRAPDVRRALGIRFSLWWHIVYGIEERLGWAAMSMEPHALWPVREYFLQ
jgi:hypothetical protein